MKRSDSGRDDYRTDVGGGGAGGGVVSKRPGYYY